MFDFDSHGERAEIDYRRVQQDYAELSKEVGRILRVVLDDVKVHEFQERAKTVESFVKKAKKPKSKEEPTVPKYPNPVEDITDLAGVRVITFFPKTLDLVEERLRDAGFKIKERTDVGEERFKAGKFGYQSIHFLVELPENRKELIENQVFKNLVCEVQVRTIMQHAWAEMEHDIQYKSSEDIPEELRRRFLALAGMIEIADREFQAIQDEDAELKLYFRGSLEDSITVSYDLATTTGGNSSSGIETENRAVSASYKSARELISNGSYAQAVELYNEKISEQPMNHLLFAGRAKAKFLDGDTRGAIDDISIAIDRVPDDNRLKELKKKFEVGQLPRVTTSFWVPYNAACESLGLGNAEDAFANFSKAQELGYNYSLASFHKSMARVLANDCDGATFFVDQLIVFPDRPMAANIVGLKAIICATCNTGGTTAFKRLEEFLSNPENATHFDYTQSPLRFLENGIHNRDHQIKPTVQKVFDLLKGERLGIAMVFDEN